MPKRKKYDFETMPKINPNAAGIDIGAAEIWVHVPPDRDPNPTQRFLTFTPDLHALADWLVKCGITSVAMESTGIYWIPLFEILEARGIDVFLVNAAHVKNVPGRKSDINDCEWLQILHSFGLLRASFHPEPEMRALKLLLRHRDEQIRTRSSHIQHIQKALELMNIKLSEVLSDVTGVSGLTIIRAILSGQHDPHVLAAMRNTACKRTEEDIVKALSGSYRDEILFMLKQSVFMFDILTALIEDCDAKVAERFSAVRPHFDTDDMPPPRMKKGTHSKNKPSQSNREAMRGFAGVDLCDVDGISEASAQTILAELGSRLDRFPTARHFCIWAGVAPKTETSGGRVIRSHTIKTRNPLNQVFRTAALAVTRSHCAFGAFFRRMRARMGPKQAVVATAHKIARVVYLMLTTRTPYQDIGSERYDAQIREREVAYLRRKAAKLGFNVTAIA